MERLTKYEPCEGGIPLVTVEDEQSALQRLAYYEDAEEAGLLIRLPCKVGDTVYVPRGTGQIEPWEMVVFAFMYGKDGKLYISARDKHHHVFQGNFIMGETCFKYRKAALKEEHDETKR